MEPGHRPRSCVVRLAARKLDGVIVPPGAILSFNERVGSYSKDAGFWLAPGSYSGSLQWSSNSVDNPNVTIALSGTVLRHASASLDSLAALASSTLDFGAHETGTFTKFD